MCVSCINTVEIYTIIHLQICAQLLQWGEITTGYIPGCAYTMLSSALTLWLLRCWRWDHKTCTLIYLDALLMRMSYRFGKLKVTGRVQGRSKKWYVIRLKFNVIVSSHKNSICSVILVSLKNKLNFSYRD